MTSCIAYGHASGCDTACTVNTGLRQYICAGELEIPGQRDSVHDV